MPITRQPLSLAGALKIIRDADCDATPEVNINDGAATIYAVEIDNTVTGNALAYVKLYNVAIAVGTGAVTVGTTTPDAVLMAPSSTRRVWVFRNAMVFSAGLTIAGVTTGGTGGTTNPTTDVRVSVVVG